MHNPKLEALNKDLQNYISAAIAKFHDQNKGIRVVSCNIESSELNPPGFNYVIKAEVQITLNNKEAP